MTLRVSKSRYIEKVVALLAILGIAMCGTFTNCQNFRPLSVSDSPLIDSLLQTGGGTLGRILDDAQNHRVQIIYTRIDRDANNVPHFRHYGYLLDTTAYFFPASMVKLPTAAIALEKLNLIGKQGIGKGTRVSFEPVMACQKGENEDSTSETGYPCIGHYVRKVFLTSDNPAQNRLYDFVGRKHLNERLWKMGYGSARITLPVHSCDSRSENYGTAVNFHNKSGKVIYRQEPYLHEDPIVNPFGNAKVGVAHFTDDGKYHSKPWDFTRSSFISLWDLHRILISIIFPEQVESSKRFILKPKDLYFLKKYMSMLPRESEYPKYDTASVQEAIVKYLVYGRENERIPDHIRIFNKVGMGFGFLTDCAYIVDTDAGAEFFLSAVVYVNEDETINDNKYDYHTTGLPFLKNLGKLFLEFEQNRPRTFRPKW